MMSPINLIGQFGDTTYTKVFVGGLAWETQKETMKKYFEQFGDILEAVVITDKNTGKSKGYGFVTFREPEAAMRACVDAAPVIDGRRANCNLASLGLQRTRPSSPQHGGNSRNFRTRNSYQGGYHCGVGVSFPSPTTFPHYAIPQSVPYNVYGYPSYSSDYNYSTNYYNAYGGVATQYSLFGGATPFYPYYHQGSTGGGAYAYSLQYPHPYQYSSISSGAVTAFPQPYCGPMSLPPTPPPSAGMNMGLTPSTLHSSALQTH